MKAIFYKIVLFLAILSINLAYSQVVVGKKEQPKQTDNYFLNLGILAAESNKSDSAIIYLSKAIELNKKNPNTYYVRSTVFYEMNRLDDALEDLNKSISINSKDEKPFYLRALIHQSKSSFSKAAKDYETLIKLNPTDSNYYFQYAYCLQEMSEYHKSIDNYLRYEKLVKSPAKEFFINIIYNFIQLKKYSDALNYLQKAEKNGYITNELIQLKITILSINSRCDEAMKLIEENSTSINNQANLLTNIGNCFIQNKKYVEAIKPLSQAYETDRSLVENLFNLAFVQQQLGNPVQTISYLEQFVNESKNRNDLKQLRDQAIRQLDAMKKIND